MRDEPKSGPESDGASGRPPRGDQPPGGDPFSSAEDQLHATRQLLIYTLRYSRVFSAETTDDWVDGLAGLDVASPEAGRAILSELREGYDWAKRQHRPDGLLAGAASGAGVFFARETAEIERHLDALAALLDQAAAMPGEADG